jgi:UDP-N-acetylmuramoyl-L-alanyl-D-glutamate--2,6-diaminopimelate ligase
LGRIAGSHADIVIVTNEDPYDDPPRQIIDHVADGARQVGKRDDESLFCIEDRRQAIHHAMRLAQSGDLVLLTGKGSEQAIMIQGGGRISWDEREVAREAIRSVRSRHAVA